MVQPRTKNINIRYHFFPQAVNSGEVKLIYCPTQVMLADAMTKALCEVKFAKFLTSHLIQDTRLDQSGSAEDQASAARLVLKQAQHKHKALDQSLQPRTDPEASKQYSDSFPLISFKSQEMSPFLQGLDHGQRFWFLSRVLLLRSSQKLGQTFNRMPSIRMFLVKTVPMEKPQESLSARV